MTKKVFAYNRLYRDGKPTGKVFRTESGSSEAAVRAEANKYNRIWNKQQKGNVYVKLVSVGTKHYKKIGKRKSRSSGFGFGSFKF